jgi:hypothetical protein
VTERTGAKGVMETLTDQERAWIGAHLTELRRSIYGQQILRWSLTFGLVVGLAAHVVGYLLRSSAPTEPLGLVADLLYSLGFALWTGVVLVAFVQIIPEAKRRQIEQALDAYEAALQEKARAGGDQASAVEEASRPSKGPL